MTIEGVAVVGCSDLDLAAAQAMAAHVSLPDRSVPTFADHADLLRQAAPDALAIFTPHLSHYRPAIDALQANCHVFIKEPLTTSVQEAVDIVGLARGRDLKVGVGHHFRLSPSLVMARRMLAEGAIGRVRLITATLTQPWLEARRGPEHAWRFDPRFAGGGILADSGIHLIDALLWTSGRSADTVSAVQDRDASGLDLVTAAAISLSGGTVATLAVSAVSPGSLFELSYHGEKGRLRATEASLIEDQGDGPSRVIPLPEATENIDANFVASAMTGAPLCCPAEEALDAVRLLEAIARSATIGQVVRLG